MTSSILPAKLKHGNSPYLPTQLEAILFAAYPGILLLGSLFSLFDPSTRAAQYDPVTQSHQPPPSYFADKRNIFNLLFVKIGWFWVTAAYLIFLFPTPLITPRRLQGLIRFAVITIHWIFVTQWFLGPPLIDRLFTLTGGLCDREGVFSSTACKAVGGRWAGGHDVSGHVFLLALGSAFLWMELLPLLLRSSGKRDDRPIQSGSTVKMAEHERPDQEPPEDKPSGIAVKLVGAVTLLSLWMLLMTAAYFHTWFEKVTGLIIAFSGIYIVHFLPRIIPSLRSVIGLPGL